MAVLQLQTLSGVAKGLTRMSESILVDDSSEEQAYLERMTHARGDLRMVKLREEIFSVIRSIVDMWSTDAGVSDVNLVPTCHIFPLTLHPRLSATYSKLSPLCLPIPH